MHDTIWTMLHCILQTKYGPEPWWCIPRHILYNVQYYLNSALLQITDQVQAWTVLIDSTTNSLQCTILFKQCFIANNRHSTGLDGSDWFLNYLIQCTILFKQCTILFKQCFIAYCRPSAGLDCSDRFLDIFNCKVIKVNAQCKIMAAIVALGVCDSLVAFQRLQTIKQCWRASKETALRFRDSFVELPKKWNANRDVHGVA